MIYLKKAIYVKLAISMLLLWMGVVYFVLEQKTQTENFKYGLVEISSKLEELDARFQKYNRSHSNPKSIATPE